MSYFTRERVRVVRIAGEGDDEIVFLKFLKMSWHVPGGGFKIKLKSLDGRGLKSMIDKIKQDPAEYDGKYLFLDQRTVDAVSGVSVPKSIRLIISDPCLEAMICQVLGSTKTFESMKEQDCKRYLRQEYGCDAITEKWLLQNITGDILEKEVRRIQCLRELQQVLREGKVWDN